MWTLGEAEKRNGVVFTKPMKISHKLTLLLSLQVSFSALCLERVAAADPVSIMAFNQANALNSEMFQNQWGQRVAGAAEDVGPVNTVAASDKNTKNPLIVSAAPNRWNFFVDGNGIFAQEAGPQTLFKINGGGVTAGLSYQWNPSVKTGLYAGYQGSQLTQNLTFNGLVPATEKFILTDNAARFGLFGSYGQADGKGFYALGLVGGTYHQFTVSDQYEAPSFGMSPNKFKVNSSANVGAPELDSMAAGGYDFKVKGFTFGPTTSLQYTYYYQNDVNVLTTFPPSPTGSWTHGGNYNTSSVLYSLGGHAAYTWQAAQDLVIVPQINLNWQHEFLETIYTPSQYRDALYTGVGVTADYKKRYTASFFYNCYACNQDLISQNIFLSLGVNF